MAATTTSYDVVPYFSGARSATHADHLSAIARLLSVPAADPNACRVLEVACGDGGNLIPMALSLPGSEFVGIDLAASAVERGRNATISLGLTNIDIRHGDILEIDDAVGTFDFVIAHGVFSWVPAEVRTALLRLIRNLMRPSGVAFVSYNAMPGDHIRSVLRQMMKMHTSGIDDPAKKIEQAKALLSLLAQVPGAGSDVYRPLLQSEVGRALRGSDFLLYHDDLAEICQPFFFAEFMGLATSEGLQFLAEATFESMSLSGLPEQVAAMLKELGSQDLIAKEQYLDFITCRGFRQTLLCHAEAPIERHVNTQRMRELRFFGDLKRDEEAQDVPPGAVTFRHRSGAVLQTDNAAAIAALDLLGARFPVSTPFDELDRATGAAEAGQGDALAEVLFAALSAGLAGVSLGEPPVLHEVSSRPVASPWARMRAETGRAVNLYHETIGLDDQAKAVLPLLDGSRTITAIRAASGLGEEAVEQELTGFAKMGLLVG